MIDKRGEFYSEGYCMATGRDCGTRLKGACGICIIGGAYRNMLSELTSQEQDLSKLCDETLKT